MGTKWTDEQKKVLETTGCNLLVSAAAGSGKTAVLVERIIRMITDSENPVDIDKFVIMTFTRAAAAQMRQKLSDALEKLIEEKPEDRRLLKQYRLLSNAVISTIDSFCIGLVRDYFHMIDIDPVFRVADDTELGLIKADCMEELLEARYAGGDRSFHELAEMFGDSRGDGELEQVIFRLAEKALSQPWPKEWLEGLNSAYETESAEMFDRTQVADTILKYTQTCFAGWLTKLREAERIANMEDGPDNYLDAIYLWKGLAEDICEKDSYTAASVRLSEFGVPRLSSKRKVNPELKESAKAILDEIKKNFGDIVKKYWFTSTDEVIDLIKKTAPYVKCLVGLAKEYLDRYAAVKKDRNLIDFSDAEHFALDILVKREDGRCIRTAAAKELQSQYAEIIIDEYQDSNLIQEWIANAIAGDDDVKPFVFTVGDVKQSIYKFRNACPELFIGKQEKYGRAEGGKLIVLDRNFRSRNEVLQAANVLFKFMMIQEMGGIDYDDSCSLKCGISNENGVEDCYKTELLIVDTTENAVSDTQNRSEVPGQTDAESNTTANGSANNGAGNGTPADNGAVNSAAGNGIHANNGAVNGAGNGTSADNGAVNSAAGNGIHADNGAVNSAAENGILANNGAVNGAGNGTLANSGAENSTTDDDADDDADGENSAASENKIALEARAAAKRVKEMIMREKLCVRDRIDGEDTMRLACYGDITILLRTMKDWSDVYARTFEDEGIPCLTDSREGFFKTHEVALMTGYLAILDNPRQDIPLTAVLYSNLCGLTVEEMAQIRIEAGPAMTFWDAVMKYYKENEIMKAPEADSFIYTAAEAERDPDKNETVWNKLDAFFKTYDELAAVKNDVDVVSLINMLYDRTGFLSYVSAMSDGVRRRANLEMLLGYAANYAKTSFSGLFSFIRYLDQLKSHNLDYGEAGSEAEVNAVHIMSIHQSKGLEFPIVILGGMSKSFNMKDAQASLVIHGDYGIGMRYVDPETRLRYPSLYSSFIKLKMTEDVIAEELRLLYVAMTRAKDKLIMIGTTGKKDGKKLTGTDWVNYGTDRIAYSHLNSCDSYMLMTYPAAVRNPQLYTVKRMTPAGIMNEDGCTDNELPADIMNEDAGRTDNKLPADKNEMSAVAGNAGKESDTLTAERLLECRNRVYRYETDEAVPIKLSVSDLKLQSMLEEYGEEIFEETGEYESGGEKTLPEFMKEEALQSRGANYGTLVHKCMQFMKLGINTYREVAEVLDGMVKDGRMTGTEREMMNPAKFVEFLKKDVAARMKKSEETGRLFREQQFMLGVKACDIDARYAGNETTVPVQGVIDVMFVESGELVILDYKTDRVDENGGADELTKRYKTQLDYYARAAEKLLGMPVKEKLIYSFCLNRVIEV